MGTRDGRVDAYIAKSAGFAQPILKRIREQMHRHCPELDETIKWGFPHFDYFGIFASMAAFKSHCALGFWKSALLGIDEKSNTAMGAFGRITTLQDLPDEHELARCIKAAMVLNEEGIPSPTRAKSKTEKPPLIAPDYFVQALKNNKAAQATFEGFNYSNQKDYVAWVIDAKTEPTRNKRIAQAIEWIAEGKVRNWKYLQK